MKRVLIVDDNEILCRITCDILRVEGYWTVPAYSAGEALELLDHESFDLVVTDWRMEGMNGLELARAIRQRELRLPVIMVTGYDPIEAEEITECLPKQNLFPALVDKIRSYLSATTEAKIA